MIKYSWSELWYVDYYKINFTSERGGHTRYLLFNKKEKQTNKNVSVIQY